MNVSDANRPLRVFEKALNGGLGEGNIGVLMSRTGTGKLAVMTSIAIDHALGGQQTLHVALNESISDVRAYDDEVLHEMLERLGVEDRAKVATEVERNKQIYTYTDGNFTATRMRTTLDLLKEHAQFRPRLIEIQNWPDFQSVTMDEMSRLKNIAQEYKCEIWLTATSHDDNAPGQIPDYISRFDEFFSVLVSLEPESKHVNLNILKSHDATPPADTHLEFDPKSMLIRWR
ncbi:MAG: hypothetical protein V3W41_05760 [Planctomycetota bacterium]